MHSLEIIRKENSTKHPTGRHREIPKEGPDFTRRRLVQRDAIVDDLKRSQQQHSIRRLTRHFHDPSNEDRVQRE